MKYQTYLRKVRKLKQEKRLGTQAKTHADLKQTTSKDARPLRGKASLTLNLKKSYFALCQEDRAGLELGLNLS